MAAAAPTELGQLKISKLLAMYAIPGIIAQVAASLYNIVDSVYIGHITDVGPLALTGLAVSFPLMNLSAAMGTLVGVGAMTMISMLLGQKKYETANKVLANVLSLNIIIGILFTLVTLPFLSPILRFFGATDATLPFAHSYMTIILAGNVFTHLYFGFNGIIRASGHPRTAMGLTLFTVAANAVLDPVFIFVLDLGIQGAAYATVICQFMALLYSLRFLSDKSRCLHFPKPVFRLNWKVARQSMAIGMGPFLMNAASCLVSLFINQQLLKFGGDLAIGSYGIANRVTFLFIMVCMGFNQGLQPIAGYNYGARLYSRVKEVFILTAKWELLVTTLCCLVSVLIPGLVARAFTNDPELIAQASNGLRLMNCCMFAVGFGIVSSNLFQCIGMVKISIFLSLSRQLIFLIPLVYALPFLLGQNGVWLSFPISDLLSVVVSAFFIVRLFRKFNKLEDGQEPSSL